MLWRRYLAPLAAAFALGFSLYCFAESAVQVRSLASENGEIEGRIAVLAQGNDVLRRRIAHLGESRDAVERLVRTELGLVRAGELVYRFR